MKTFCWEISRSVEYVRVRVNLPHFFVLFFFSFFFFRCHVFYRNVRLLAYLFDNKANEIVQTDDKIYFWRRRLMKWKAVSASYVASLFQFVGRDKLANVVSIYFGIFVAQWMKGSFIFVILKRAFVRLIASRTGRLGQISSRWSDEQILRVGKAKWMMFRDRFSKRSWSDWRFPMRDRFYESEQKRIERKFIPKKLLYKLIPSC